MKITCEQWMKIEAAAKQAQDGLSALQDALTNIAYDHKNASNQPEAEFLIRLASLVSDASGSKEVMPYFYHPQSEWMGGDSSNPKNYRKREPHIVGDFPGYLDGSC